MCFYRLPLDEVCDNFDVNLITWCGFWWEIDSALTSLFPLVRVLFELSFKELDVVVLSSHFENDGN